MISSAELLSDFENCQRWGYWSQRWWKHRMLSAEMFHTAVRQALVDDAPDPGEHASETFMTLAAERGLDVPSSVQVHIYTCARNHAAAADIIATAIRQNGERWLMPTSVNGWASSVMVAPRGDTLRRFLAVSHWNDDRAFFEKRSWYVLGEMAHYRLPMELVVAVLGPLSGGRRHHYWQKALLHPQGSELRFRRSRRAKIEGFRETWVPIYREDHDTIERERWLQAMYTDGVLQESLFVVKIPLPEPSQLQIIRDLASRQLERVSAIAAVPEKQLSTCFNPIHPCPFRGCCWSDPEVSPDAGGYDAR